MGENFGVNFERSQQGGWGGTKIEQVRVRKEESPNFGHFSYFNNVIIEWFHI